MAAPRIVVTRHARARWQERVFRRLGLEDLDAIARRAWRYGRRDRRLHKGVGVRRIYMGVTFVYKLDPDAIALVTVLPPRHG